MHAIFRLEQDEIPLHALLVLMSVDRLLQWLYDCFAAYMCGNAM